jgi:callose synthase
MDVKLVLLSQTRKYADDVERKRGQYEHYNILPLYAAGVKPSIMELPEVGYMYYM